MYSCVTVFTHARVLNETQALKHVVRESLHACMLHDRRALWELTHLFRVTHLFAASPTYCCVTHLFAASPTYLPRHPPICRVTHLFAASPTYLLRHPPICCVTHLFAASPTYLQHHPPICCVTHLFAASVAAGARVATAGQCSHSFWHLTLSVEGR